MKIVICGSMSFAREMLEAQKILEAQGHQVVIPKFTEEHARQRLPKNEDANRKREHDLIRDYYRKILESDAILVLNYDAHGIQGYIGGNSFLEMGFAHVLGKSIYLLYPIPNMNYTDEMQAMDPIILYGNLSKLSVKQ
jgi:nucleoside 2-deoxyribosyltransferase